MNIQLILHNNYNKTKQSITKPYAILWPMPSSCPIHYPGCMDGWMVVWMALWSSHKHPWCSVLVLLLWIINPSLFIYPTPLSATSVVVITGTDIPDTANRECCPGGHYWDYCDGAFSLSHLPQDKMATISQTTLLHDSNKHKHMSNSSAVQANCDFLGEIIDLKYIKSIRRIKS